MSTVPDKELALHQFNPIDRIIHLFSGGEGDIYIFLLEGYHDEIVFRRIYDRKNGCFFVSLPGRADLLQCFRALVDELPNLDESEKQRIIPVSDRDFLEFGVDTLSEPRIQRTDFHDIDIDIIEYGKFKESIKRLIPSESKFDQIFRDSLEQSRWKGLLRLTNEVLNASIKFDDLTKLKNRHLKDIESCINWILNSEVNRNRGIDFSAVKSKFFELNELHASSDTRQISSGVDFFEFLAFHFNHARDNDVVGSRTERDMTILAESCYSGAEFEKSQLHASIEKQMSAS